MQDCEPQPGHCCVAPGAQTPPSEQAPNAPHVQSSRHVCDWSPQLPQLWVWTWPGWHCGFAPQPAETQPPSAHASPAGQLPEQVPPQPSDWPQEAPWQFGRQQFPPAQI